MSFFNFFGDYLSTPQKNYSVPTISPTGETIYENKMTEKIKNETQNAMNYRYNVAHFPNDKNYLLPLYDRNNPYPDSRNKSIVNSPLYKISGTEIKPVQNKEGISPLTGLPFDMTIPNVESSITRSNHKMDLKEEPSYHRRLEQLTGVSDYYVKKQEVSWNDFHAPVTQNINGTPIYSDTDYKRARENFSLNREGTNLLPFNQKTIPSIKAGTFRVKQKNVDDLRPQFAKKQTVFVPPVGAPGSLTSSLPFIQNTDKWKVDQKYRSSENVRGGQIQNNNGARVFSQVVPKKENNKTLFSWLSNPWNNNTTGRANRNVELKDAKKSHVLYSYYGNQDVLVPGTKDRKGHYSKIRKNKDYQTYYGNGVYQHGNYNDNSMLRESRKNKNVEGRKFITNDPVGKYNLYREKVVNTGQKKERIVPFHLNGASNLGANSTFKVNHSKVPNNKGNSLSTFDRNLDIPKIRDTFVRI